MCISKDYSGEEIASSSRGTSQHPGTLGQKPNQRSSSELVPPPPYSPDLAGKRGNDESSGYGSVRNSMDPDEEQRVGLLSRQEQPSLPERIDTEPTWKYANPRIVSILSFCFV